MPPMTSSTGVVSVWVVGTSSVVTAIVLPLGKGSSIHG